MKKYLLIVFSVWFFAGCQPTPEAAESEPLTEAETMMEEAPAANRPDPQNPSGGNSAVPADWIVQLDDADAEAVVGADADSVDIFFVNMTPGWHITTGPSAIFVHPASTASGEYEAMTDIHLFDPGERREAFGLVLGGQNLDTDSLSYDYFLIRNSKEFLIKRRTGSETAVIQDWTPSDAIVPYDDPTQSSVLNQLKVQVGADSVTFFINESEVAALPREQMHTDGVVGLRVNHALNLHVSDLAVTPTE